MRALNRISVQKNVLRSRDVNCNPIPPIDRLQSRYYESIGPQLIGERFQFVVIAILVDRLCDRKPVASLTWKESERPRMARAWIYTRGINSTITQLACPSRSILF
jgi:hypothetical protein